MNETKNHYKSIDELFIPMRTQPPHVGHIGMLEAACRNAKTVIIGIGSANRQDMRNPYTADERELMLKKSLEDIGLYENYRFVHIPDFDSDEDWVQYLADNCGVGYGTTVVSGNPWIQKIFPERGYKVLEPKELIGSNMIDICATNLRDMIAHGDESWKKYAASGCVYYFEEFGGAQRIARYYEQKKQAGPQEVCAAGCQLA